MAYGFLVHDQDDYDFFVDFVQDNKNVLNTCNTLLINNLSNEAAEDHSDSSIFLESGAAFLPTFVSLLITIVLICCFGVCYEFFRHRGVGSKHPPSCAFPQKGKMFSQMIPLCFATDKNDVAITRAQAQL